VRSISKEASAAARLTASLLPWVTAALFWACPAPAVGAEEPEIVGAAGRPNILLLISDDQAWSDFGFMGHGVIETPRLDALAAEGRTFPRGYVPTALCRPSLATIITGLYPHQHGITGNDPPKGVAREEMLQLIAATETLPDLLRPLGYESLQTGKWWEGNCQCGGFSEGMTHGDPGRGGRHGDVGLDIGRKTMAPALDFMSRCATSDTPFFLWYAPFLPHRPHNPPTRLLERYLSEGVPEPIARYRAMCTWFDETCGELLDHVDAIGEGEDTLVILVTDNGWIQRPDAQGYAARSKRTSYEGGVRTPIVLRHRGSIKPARLDVPVSSVDLAPTILLACGAGVPEQLPGVDLLTEDGPAPRPLFGAAFTHDVVEVGVPARSVLSRWVIDGEHKLIDHRDGDVADELFDLAADPWEREALGETAISDRLREELSGWWDPTPARPNFLVVVTDDQRFDQLGAAGHPHLKTPVMDELAARGVRFENAFVTTPICAASRASILTGRREGRHGYTFGTPPMGSALAEGSFPMRLRESGYRTGFVGKWGVRFEKGVMDGAYDLFKPMGLPYRKEGKAHLTDRIGEAAESFVAEGGDDPFCLMVSFWAPHAEDSHPDQYLPPMDLAGMYDHVDVDLPPLNEAGFDALPDFLQRSLGRKRWHWRFDERQKQVQRTRDYWSLISGVDRALGGLLEALEEAGVAEDTVVLLMGDNGYFLGERGLAGKWLIYEESIRVPLIVMDPRAPEPRRGAVEAATALNVDLAPTLLDLAGVDRPAAYEGRSLAPLLQAARPVEERPFLVEHRFRHAEIPTSIGVRGSRWVYAIYDSQDPPYEQLFDLESDPDELVNLAGEPEYGAILEAQRALCDALRAR
jgi:arylsulfatase A-like enzyme